MKKQTIKDLKELIDMYWHNTVGLFRSSWIMLFKSTDRPRLFFGKSAYWFAKRYADKKYRQWPNGVDRLGKQQFVIPIDQDGLLVCSKLEIKYLQKKGVVYRKRHYPKLVRKNYYQTPQN